MKFNSSMPLSHFILISCFYLSLIRGTNMGLFYPSAQSELGGIDYTFQIIMNLLLLMGLASYFFLKNDFKFITQSLSRAVIGLIFVGITISTIFSFDMMQSTKFMLAVVSVSLPTILYVYEFGSKRLIEALAYFICIIAYLNIIYVVLFPQYAIMTEIHDGAWRGLFLHKNIAGSAFGAGLFIIVSQVDLTKKIKSLVYIVAAIICLAFVIFSKSSTALVSLSVMSLSMIFFYGLLHLKNKKDRLSILLISLSSFTLIYVFLGNYLMEVFFDVINKDPTLTGRTDIWLAVMDKILQNPITGFGPGVSSEYEFMIKIQQEVGWEVNSFHNSYLDMMVQFGIPVSILFLGLVFYRLFQAIFSSSINRQVVKNLVLSISLTFSMLIVSMSESGCLFNRSIFFIFIISGLCIISDMRIQKLLR
jgi:exopolysaccharide production protein ExoQ